ncbi:MAG: metal-dependent hydrolase [Candidatus Acidiferrales bacterium]|jgi:membrane-bound metal-dependent hydrolase YbcI (DUF457 family)
MDTITHGIAGALLAKAFFDGDDLFTFRPYSQARLVTFAATLGAVFPDSDVLLDFVSRDPLRIITWHRGITHSFVFMPLFAVVLAWLTHGIARRTGREAPSLALLSLLAGIGIASHIFLDLLTNYGTMIWSPVKWSRPAWDLLFIVDFTFSALLLLPQVLAALCARREVLTRRAIRAWCICFALAFLIWRLALGAGYPFSPVTFVAIGATLFALFILPAIRGWGLTVERRSWCRAGTLCVAAYLVLAAFAHHAARRRTEQFASSERLDVQSLAALPLPPSVFHWNGLVLTPRGVYEKRMDVSALLWPGSPAGPEQPEPIEYRYYPDALPNPTIAAARELPEVRSVLWFARFPVIRSWEEGSETVVEIEDVRFSDGNRRPAAFTYRVRFDAAGHVLSKGWRR